MSTKFYVYIYDWNHWYGNGRRTHRITTLRYSFESYLYRDPVGEAMGRAIAWMRRNGFSVNKIREFEFHIAEEGDVRTVRYPDGRPTLIPA